MDEQLKRRLVGGGVIVSLIVIFVPMLLDEPADREQTATETRIPQRPEALRQTPEAQQILPNPIRTEAVEPSPGEAESHQAQPREDQAEAWRPETADDLEASVSGDLAPSTETAAGRSTPSAWQVQVASFAHLDNATRLVERLKQADMPAHLQEVRLNGKTHYRVQILPQLDRKQAEILIERIEKEFGLKPTLLRYSD